MLNIKFLVTKSHEKKKTFRPKVLHFWQPEEQTNRTGSAYFNSLYKVRKDVKTYKGGKNENL